MERKRHACRAILSAVNRLEDQIFEANLPHKDFKRQINSVRAILKKVITSSDRQKTNSLSTRD